MTWSKSSLPRFLAEPTLPAPPSLPKAGLVYSPDCAGCDAAWPCRIVAFAGEQEEGAGSDGADVNGWPTAAPTVLPAGRSVAGGNIFSNFAALLLPHEV